MAHPAPPPAAVPVRKLEPQAAEEGELKAIAALHRRALPHTASSRAGADVVAALYGAVLRDPDGCVLVARIARGEGAEEGGFASGTTSLRETEVRVRRALRERPAVFAKLALRNLLAPLHLAARAAWERRIPREKVGYILTIGVTPGSPARGGDVLRALEAAFASRGAAESWVDTEASNERAIAFYERNGYAVVSRRFGQVLLQRVL